jgi:mannose-1-phosphate guanylyltransferase/phosphomannomutase
MMETADSQGINLLGENVGGYIFPEFQSAFDAMFATVKLLEMVAKSKIKLSAVAAQVPKITMVSKTISCPMEAKGKVLRTIVDKEREANIDLTDGVKIFYDEDWLLILPDPARPIIHLYAEAKTDKQAQKLVEDYIKEIDAIL